MGQSVKLTWTSLEFPIHFLAMTIPMASPYDIGLDKNPVNFSPLTPLQFLEWSASACPQRTALIYMDRRFTWAETHARCRRLASALVQRGIGRGDTVAAILWNTPEMFECQFGVPMSGAVLNTINVRLDTGTIAFMLDHSEARVLITDREFSQTLGPALSICKARPLVIDVDDPGYIGPGVHLGETDYEAFLATGDPAFARSAPQDEWDAIALNYTSGTTGNPKGVVYHHRGAYLAALGTILAGSVPRYAVFLWTAPMFHCNGWCFPWAAAALAGTGVCLRKIEAATILALIREHKVTHFGGAPIVHNLLLNAPAALWEGITHKVKAYIAGAAPPLATIEAMERHGVELTHVYGLTETYGPATLCVRQEEWCALAPREAAERLGRQGIRFVMEEEETMVLHSETLEPVPWDGCTLGEVMFRGNMTMKGYLKNPKATAEAFAGGWFRSGDLAVVEPDEAISSWKDRHKDIIISGGGQNSLLDRGRGCALPPPGGLRRGGLCAARSRVGRARPARSSSSSPAWRQARLSSSRTVAPNLAHYKVPRTVVCGPLPKTATGKIQKYLLRNGANLAETIE